MKEEFYNYLRNINISEVAQKKVEEIYNEILLLYNNIDIKDILITNLINNDSIEYQSLWLFNEDFAIECKNFLSQQEDFDLCPYNEIIYYNIKKSNYKLNGPISPNSNVSITILTNNGRASCNLIATGVNCTHVIKISQKYFLRKMNDMLYSE